ncbi:toxin-antitoxin system TumE family protein [Sinorhizobium meliloti]|uniref:Uncharacterized protein n=1 Tax=Rhizobium meliloti TaxID=382 RepID=A0AAW9TSR2_RHIML|nr:DUF6516 family protein [Sinorhizobium meliloti]MQW35546.1 hypothetical protein [Sinorhizobium meliloti]
MKAQLLQRSRTEISESAFYEVVVWHVPSRVPGSVHPYKYRLALVIEGECVLRYDNERGKGDHRHMLGKEEPIEFISLAALLADFKADAERILG